MAPYVAASLTRFLLNCLQVAVCLQGWVLMPSGFEALHYGHDYLVHFAGIEERNWDLAGFEETS